MKIKNSSDVRRQYVKPAAKVIGIKSQQVICQSFGTESFGFYDKEYNGDEYWN